VQRAARLGLENTEFPSIFFLEVEEPARGILSGMSAPVYPRNGPLFPVCDYR